MEQTKPLFGLARRKVERNISGQVLNRGVQPNNLRPQSRNNNSALKQQEFGFCPTPRIPESDYAPSQIEGLKPTAVFNAYWRFAAERQAIFLQRIAGSQSPWTEDPILQEYRFTNAYRACDRVSQYLIRNVIYAGDSTHREVFFRILLFKIFNKIETWELLCAELGSPTAYEFRADAYDKVLSKALSAGTRVYSSAYIMPTGTTEFHGGPKHRFHLWLLGQMLKDDLPNKIAENGTLRGTYEQLLNYPSLGPFLAYQYAIDLNYSELLGADEMEFVVPGPGALDGISKCFSNWTEFDPARVIQLVTDAQYDEFRRLEIHFRNLWGRHLQLIDCQNFFCEISKYSRVSHPEFVGVAARTRIKQRFKRNPEPLNCWFPPKWRLNDAVSHGLPV